MKKFIKYIFGIILFMGFISEVSAAKINVEANEESGYCVYNYNSAVIYVQQTSNNNASVSFGSKTGDKTSNGETYISLDENGTTYTYRNSMGSNTFFKDGEFYCPQFYANTLDQRDKYNSNSIDVYFSTDENNCTPEDYQGFGKVKCTDTEKISKVQKTGTTAKKCTYSVDVGGQNAQITVENVSSATLFSVAGEQKVKWSNNDAGSYKAKFSQVPDSFFFTNGMFECKPLATEVCSYSDNSKMIYWKDPSNSKSNCGGINLTGSETIGGNTKIESGVSTWNKTNGEALKFAKKIYSMVKIIIPILIVILSIVDFLKVVLLSDEKNYSATWSKFIKRIIIGLIFFAVPAIISLILELSGLGKSGILNVFV